MDEPLYWLAATQLPGIGPVTLHRWLEYAGDIVSLFKATPSVLKEAGFSESQQHALRQPDWKQAEQNHVWAAQNHCRILCWPDPDYPSLLRQIHGAPLMLYVRGDTKILSDPQLAIVGSRHATPGGCETAFQFAGALVKAGFVITSGLALGIDGASHRGALGGGGGRTIAVLGTGLQHIYPKTHQALAEKIIQEGGAIISELPPKTPPRPQNFPLRNRIISGLACGVLVVEAARRSGSLITARYALEQNREVFAIPGSIHNPQTRGCHDLIRQGAKLTDSIQEILIEVSATARLMKDAGAPQPMPVPACVTDPLQNRVLQQVGYEVTVRDAIIARAGLTAAEVSSILLALELSGWVESVPGGYVRVPAGKT